MTNKIICNAEDLTAIADAVRASNGSTNTYNVPELSAAAVNAIGAGGSGVNIDDTLTVSGAAADAKVTGDKFKALTEEIAKLPTTGGVQSDWSVNDESDPAFVKNRTHWVERAYEPIVWDGSTDGRDSVDIGPTVGAPAGMAYAYKVSDHVFKQKDLANTRVYVTAEDVEFEAVKTNVQDVIADAIWIVDYVYQGSEGYQSVGTIICTNIAGDFTATMGVVIPSAGTYIFNSSGNPHTVEITDAAAVYHTIDEKFLPHFIGWPGEGEGAEVFNDKENNVASGTNSHAEGANTTASGDCSHAEGRSTTATDKCTHAEGANTTASGDYSHAEGFNTTASGDCSHAEGFKTIASGSNSHAEGEGTIAASTDQHVIGRYNKEDIANRYVHIVGNGSAQSGGAWRNSNAHTLDWDGNAWYQGTVESAGILLTSPNGTKYKITVADDGTLNATAVTE